MLKGLETANKTNKGNCVLFNQKQITKREFESTIAII